VAVLTLIRGLPGSGKSTLAEKISKKTNAVHIENDKVVFLFLPRWITGIGEPARKIVLMSTDFWLRQKNVVVSNVFYDHASLIPFAQIAKEHNAWVDVLEPVTPWKHDIKKLASMEREGRLKVGKKTVKKFADNWENLDTGRWGPTDLLQELRPKAKKSRPRREAG